MNDEITALHKRVQELEAIALEYTRLSHLIDYAAQGQDMARYMAQSVLYVDPATRLITDANDATLELLGYPRSDLLAMTIDTLELSAEEPSDTTSADDALQARVYAAVYRHHGGYPLPVKVSQHSLYREDRDTLYYRLTDMSLHRRLWHELQRREDDGFKFQQKLTTLNEITIELSRIESFDLLCQHIIRFGVDRLGFDRLGLWLVDAEHGMMRGTYGMDEHGNIRAEHDQSWSYAGKQISEFITGKTSTAFVFDDSPLYNEKSEIIRYGWQVTVPVLHGNRCIGTLAADNYRRNQPIRNYEPELLRLYGITVAHLLELSRSREQATALRVAQELGDMLREFITSIGHDFRTPLAVISNKAYLIRRTQETERLHGLATDIQQQVKHISSKVDSMLEFIALQRGPTLTRTQTHLAPLLTSIILAHQSMSAAKNVRVDAAIHADLTVLADPAYLKHALEEIFKNAVLYTAPDGWVRVDGVMYPHEVGIRIQDSGIGMDKSTLQRVFDPLYRGDQARSEQRSGLGLTIAKAIVEAHGGHILADSFPGKGSTFEVVLPKE